MDTEADFDCDWGSAGEEIADDRGLTGFLFIVILIIWALGVLIGNLFSRSEK